MDVTYKTSPSRLLGRLAHGAIRALDRLSARVRPQTDGGALPVSSALSRRSLWGHIPRAAAAHPAGAPLLALSFDLDYQADTDVLPDLVALMDDAGVQATLFCIGKLVEADPEPYRAALHSGHEIANHTWSHPDNPVLNPDREFWHLSQGEMADEIERAQESFERLLGVRPIGFRTPHFKDAPHMMDALQHTPEICYVSTTLANKNPLAAPYFPTKLPLAGQLSLHFSHVNERYNSDVLMIPLTPCPEHRWSPFCSYDTIRRPSDPARGAGLHELDELLPLWQQMLNGARDDGFASVYFDPMDMMRDASTRTVFREMLSWATQQGWRVTTLREIEHAWRVFLTGAPASDTDTTDASSTGTPVTDAITANATALAPEHEAAA